MQLKPINTVIVRGLPKIISFSQNLNELSRKHQSYPKSAITDVFKPKICIRHSSTLSEWTKEKFKGTEIFYQSLRLFNFNAINSEALVNFGQGSYFGQKGLVTLFLSS